MRADRTALDALLAEDFTEIGASGRLWTREAMLVELPLHPVLGAPAVDEQSATLLDEHHVLLRYRLRVDGHRSRRCSLWIVKGGRGLLRFHQGTRID